jgi:hypothetical protein
MPIFSRPYLLAWQPATQYLGFKELKEDSQWLIIVNPKYWLAAMSGGILFEIWPFEDRRDLLASLFGTLHLSGVNQSWALWTQIFTRPHQRAL